MWQDSESELADLAAMHTFCAGIAERVLGHAVPVPSGLSPASQPANLSSEQRVALTLNIQRRWMNLLNMAISAEMYRNALNESTSSATVEALLRYYTWKANHVPGDRDKADLLVTFLLKREKLDVSDPEVARHSRREFEAKLVKMLGEPPLPDEHAQLAREFEFLRVEVEEIKHFDKLVDSGVIARVRDIKESFGDSFYHPRVLAAVAVHNVSFGEHFATLFRSAALKINAFAQKVRREGGSAADSELAAKFSKVNEQLLSDEYQKAQAHFHDVSRYKKAVETRTTAPVPAAPPSPSATETVEALPASGEVLDVQRKMRAQIEESKLKSVEESVRNFVRTLGSRATCLVPLRNVNLALVAAEIEAFRADFGDERSFRADSAAAHRRVVTVLGRVLSEAKDFESKQNSEYLWKPHADSLAFLLNVARGALDEADKLVAVAEQRGLAEKALAMKSSTQRLRTEMQRTAQALERISARAISQ